ncbi:MAG TPA: methylmalonyl Co-A mutase-associated GTPase MeaB [Ktedonobacterales bacterium]
MDIVERLLAGDRRALARMVTLIENDAPQAREHLARLHPHSGRAQIVGVTGSPGAGKSTLVMQIVRDLRKQNKKVGVVAVDPSSPFTGGAILGDRIRMQELAGDPNVFIRSMASRGSLGGLAASTRDVVRALDAAGYDLVVIETVGAGQAEVEIVRAAHTVLVVTVPGMGDDIQALKAGILEIADIFVVNKADRPGADQAVAELKMLLGLAWRRPKEAHPWHIPILKTSATQGEGISELVEAILKHRVFLSESGQLAQRSQRQAQSEVLALLQHELLLRLQASVDNGEWQQFLDAVVEREISPYEVADQLARRLGLGHEAISRPGD